MTKKLLWALGVVAAGVGVFFVATPGCACLSEEETARLKMRSVLDQAISAQRTRFDSTGRYAGTLEALGESFRYETRVTLTVQGDSAYLLVGQAAGLTCRFEGRPSAPPDARPTCAEDR